VGIYDTEIGFYLRAVRHLYNIIHSLVCGKVLIISDNLGLVVSVLSFW